jgi:signal transduction histidine kinase/CheY-like chemotaxis protein
MEIGNTFVSTTQFPMELAVSEFVIDGTRHFTGIVNEITERRRSEDALRESEARERIARMAAEHAGQVKDDFLATLSHELRTPLNAILGWARLIAVDTGDQERVNRGIQVITRNAKAQGALISDLLFVGQITAGKFRLDIGDVALSDVVAAAVDSIRPVATAKGIELRSVLDPTIETIQGDAGRLQQVVWNLLSNAVKFTPEGGSVQVTLAKRGVHIEIVVSDSGAGMASEFIPYVFERFRQEEASSALKYGGLGLGLSIVKHLVALHGGSVRAESPGQGKGATFTVALPISPAHDRSVDDEPKLEKKRMDLDIAVCRDFDLSGSKVLAIDDHPDTLGLLKRVLEECHAHVIVASSADEGLQALAKHRPQIVLCDIGMPEKDGHAFIKAMREQGYSIPAIAVTAFARPEDKRRALQAGYQGHIAKPLEPAELVSTVAAFVRAFDDVHGHA